MGSPQEGRWLWFFTALPRLVRTTVLYYNLCPSFIFCFCRLTWRILHLICPETVDYCFTLSLGWDWSMYWIGWYTHLKFSLKSRIVIIFIRLGVSIHFSSAFDYNNIPNSNTNPTLNCFPPHHSLLSTPLPSTSSYAYREELSEILLWT